MLLDPLEEQLDLPAALVEGANRGGRQGEVVGEEDQGLGRLGVVEADTPQMVGIMLAGIVTIERDGLIADDAGRTVGRGRIDAMGVHVRFGAGDKEGGGLMERMKAGDDTATTEIGRASCRERV